MSDLVTYSAEDHARMQFVRAVEDWLLFGMRTPRPRADREHALLRSIQEKLTALQQALPASRAMSEHDAIGFSQLFGIIEAP